ncbi:hypothetical protein CSB09_03505 [Candidatus Gracilibacteria bacterium]|nr:MAG: hypothetical protein CSB09_03505 [Candidatus Gracilibacteria bacterium]
MKSLPLLKNPQIYQTIFLMIILNIGILVYDIYFDYTKLFLTFGSAALFDTLLYRYIVGKWRFPFTGINVGFGIAFFLRTKLLWLYPFAVFLALASKYFFRIRGKHFFNPSNFGVFVVLVLFPFVAWTDPLQWGSVYTNIETSSFWIFCIILAFGGYIISLVHKSLKIDILYIVLAFLITHFGIYFTLTQETSFLSLLSGNTTSFLTFYTPSFWIFVFYMITDPGTILRNRISMIFFGALVAVGFYLLQYYINENYSLLASLFLASIFIPVIRFYDTKKLYYKITIGNVIAIFMFLFVFVQFLYTIGSNGKPDLVFDNRCAQIVCGSNGSLISR